MLTIRGQIAKLLEDKAMTALDISQAVGVREKEVYEHLVHIQKSRDGGIRCLHVSPCSCLSCGFVFRKRSRLTRPGRCPRCRQSRISHAVFSIGPGKARGH